MRMTLYHGEPNGPSLTVLATLFAKQVPAELVRIDLTRGERHALQCARRPPRSRQTGRTPPQWSQKTVPTSRTTSSSIARSAIAAMVIDGLHAAVFPGIKAPSST